VLCVKEPGTGTCRISSRHFGLQCRNRHSGRWQSWTSVHLRTGGSWWCTTLPSRAESAIKPQSINLWGSFLTFWTMLFHQGGWQSPATWCDLEIVMNCRHGRAWAYYLWCSLQRLHKSNTKANPDPILNTNTLFWYHMKFLVIFVLLFQHNLSTHSGEDLSVPAILLLSVLQWTSEWSWLRIGHCLKVLVDTWQRILLDSFIWNESVSELICVRKGMEGSLQKRRALRWHWNCQAFCRFSAEPLFRMFCFPRQGIIKRDEMVFTIVRDKRIPIVMVTSGGYQRRTAEVIARSILNLRDKRLITNSPSTNWGQLVSHSYRYISTSNPYYMDYGRGDHYMAGLRMAV